MVRKVLVLWFEDDSEFVSDYLPHDLERDNFTGYPLWKKDGQNVYFWARDCVSCRHDRYIVFGPFKNTKEANSAFLKLNDGFKGAVIGHRIINEHCYEAAMDNRIPAESIFIIGE